MAVVGGTLSVRKGRADREGTVPRRSRRAALRPSTAERELATIARDREHGARTLSLRALAAIDREVRSWRDVRPEHRRRRAYRLARLLRASQPAMGPFRAWAVEVDQLAGSLLPALVARGVRGWVRRTRGTLAQEPVGIRRVARRALPGGARLVTLSRSSSVKEALLAVAPGRRPSSVVVLESLPGGEGRAFARDLRRSGLRARWVRDGSLARALAKADLVVVGADAVEPGGTLVHKVGTRRLAISAFAAGVPFVVVAGRSKWVPPRAVPRALPPLFDRTPARLITAYWTDEGVLRGGGRAPRSS